MPALTTEEFLAAAVKHSKNKLEVDFAALAEETGMSLGGAANKFRAIMKQIEEDRASGASGASGAAESPPVTPKKRGRKAGGSNGASSAKKPRSAKKNTPKDEEDAKVKSEDEECEVASDQEAAENDD